MNAFEFEPFDKIARLKRELVITEKLDGTNAQVAIFELDSEALFYCAQTSPYCIDIFGGDEPGESPLAVFAGSRKRWVAPEGTIANKDEDGWLKGTDNFAFAAFVRDNARELVKLGPGRHYGEWYGKGIQRGYGLEEKRFALFNTSRWGRHNPNTPTCCEVVPIFLPFAEPDEAMERLAKYGSFAVPGFMNPEGIVVYHTASRTLYKQTFDMDGGKWSAS